MKISKVEANCLKVPIKTPYTDEPRTVGMVLVEIETDDGVTGYGIARDLERFGTRELINRDIAPFLIGKDPLFIEQIWADSSEEITATYKARMGVVGRAISACDIALWDIKGKFLDQPIYKLIGGAFKDSVPVYVTCGFNIFSDDDVVGISKKIADEGHPFLKYQVVAADRGNNVSVDIERLQAIRQAVGDDIKLIVDGNARFDLNQAREFVRGIEPLNITCFDHSVSTRDVRLMLELRKHTSIPLAARAFTESPWDNREMIMSGAVDIMHANVMDGGGYTTCVKVAHMAELFHLPFATGGGWQIHNGHLIAGIANGWLSEVHLIFNEAYNALLIDPPEVKQGRLYFSDKPGLGIEFDGDAILEYRDP